MTRIQSALVRRALLPDGARVDCRIAGGVIAETGPRLATTGVDLVIDAEGGALIPGLADHHLHLAAMAAHRESVDLTAVPAAAVAATVAAAAPGRDGWVRVVGHDDAHGELTREGVDRCRADVPVRVQHRSGALWVLNSVALRRIGADSAAHPGIERDSSGRPTGRLWRADDWLRQLIDTPPPCLAEVGRLLASFGVTHVADATPDDAAGPVITDALARNELPQKVMVMGATLGTRPYSRVTLGPRKIIVADHEPPDLDQLAADIARAHGAGRPVAVHCVSRTALAVTLAAVDSAGAMEGDRIEHCAVSDLSAARMLAERGLRVVTQPTLITRRGDDYLERCERADLPDLWRYAGLLTAGVRVAPSSDAPYGDPNPWACLRAARDRATPSGVVLNPDERIAAETALRGMWSHLNDPGGPPRQVRPGAAADLVLLDRPLERALANPDAGCVRATWVDGVLIYQR